MKHLVLGHADLDGIFSIINVYNIIKNPEENFLYMVASYNNIDKIIPKISRETYDVLWILDINITKEQIHALYKANNNRAKKVIWIDHHEYEFSVDELLKTNYPDMNCTFIHDETISACLATNRFIGNINKKAQEKCKELSIVGDIYDMWRKEDDRFLKIGYPLNELYWAFKYEKFFNKFKNGLVLDQECKDTIERIKKEREAYIEETVAKYHIYNKEADVEIFYNPKCEHTNYFTLIFPAKFYIILKEGNTKSLSYSIRIYDPEFKLTVQEVFSILKKRGIKILNSGGHKKIGGIAVEYDDNENFLEAINEIFEKGH